MKPLTAIVLSALLMGTGCAANKPAKSTTAHKPAPQANKDLPTMQLGNFSVSLAVKDIAASRAFYEKLGFVAVSGDQSQNWLVLKNENTKIGLFQGMFPRNTLTFNPGWDSDKNTLPNFQDVRELQAALKSKGLAPEPAADEATSGPAYFMLMDPDGNPILFDQHVDRPKK